ncbi:hypothetical protein [Novosphingobium sp.]|uniref:hypothetical protein n=1 Tax=Novosphingobium sp. TaxID=1874826 RepID=UPI003D142B33
MTTAAQVLAARHLRDVARSTVKTDVSIVRLALAERSLLARVRDRVVLSVTQTAEEGVALADENRVIVGLTLAAAVGWVFRRPLGTLAGRMSSLSRRALKRWRR